MVRHRKSQLKRLAKQLAPDILRTALAIKHATSINNEKMSGQVCRLVYSHLMPQFTEAILDIFDPRHQIILLAENKNVRWNFLELSVAIELINISKGKKPGNGFIRALKLCTPGKGDENLFLYHLATLLYFDKRNKLFKAIINNRDFPALTSSDIIKLARKEVWRESRASSLRLDSDFVKIKGAVKEAKILPLDDGRVEDQIDEPLKQLYQDELITNLKKDLSEYIAKAHRSRRQRNILAFIDYLLTTKDSNINVKKAAAELKVSRKTLHQIIKSLQNNPGFKRLIDAFRLK